MGSVSCCPGHSSSTDSTTKTKKKRSGGATLTTETDQSKMTHYRQILEEEEAIEEGEELESHEEEMARIRRIEVIHRKACLKDGFFYVVARNNQGRGGGDEVGSGSSLTTDSNPSPSTVTEDPKGHSARVLSPLPPPTPPRTDGLRVINTNPAALLGHSSLSIRSTSSPGSISASESMLGASIPSPSPSPFESLLLFDSPTGTSATPVKSALKKENSLNSSSLDHSSMASRSMLSSSTGHLASSLPSGSLASRDTASGSGSRSSIRRCLQNFVRTGTEEEVDFSNTSVEKSTKDAIEEEGGGSLGVMSPTDPPVPAVSTSGGTNSSPIPSSLVYTTTRWNDDTPLPLQGGSQRNGGGSRLATAAVASPPVTFKKSDYLQEQLTPATVSIEVPPSSSSFTPTRGERGAGGGGSPNVGGVVQDMNGIIFENDSMSSTTAAPRGSSLRNAPQADRSVTQPLGYGASAGGGGYAAALSFSILLNSQTTGSSTSCCNSSGNTSGMSPRLLLQVSPRSDGMLGRGSGAEVSAPSSPAWNPNGSVVDDDDGGDAEHQLNLLGVFALLPPPPIPTPLNNCSPGESLRSTASLGDSSLSAAPPAARTVSFKIPKSHPVDDY